jgi:dienelactone hydrolase
MCDKNVINDKMRSLDAYCAKEYLESLEFVDLINIAVIGWSHGGWAVMKIADGYNRNEGSEPFKAAVAIYPWCTKINTLDTP